jgi:hypothetical protein
MVSAPVLLSEGSTNERAPNGPQHIAGKHLKVRDCGLIIAQRLAYDGRIPTTVAPNCDTRGRDGTERNGFRARQRLQTEYPFGFELSQQICSHYCPSRARKYSSEVHSPISREVLPLLRFVTNFMAIEPPKAVPTNDINFTNSSTNTEVPVCSGDSRNSEHALPPHMPQIYQGSFAWCLIWLLSRDGFLVCI